MHLQGLSGVLHSNVLNQGVVQANKGKLVYLNFHLHLASILFEMVRVRLGGNKVL